ncbi:phenylacetate--CoA ligase family protein [bacterium AH-315-J21]|nr:phenylacetate--CoA ligase family protein [bacterium AH-315-J21]
MFCQKTIVSKITYPLFLLRHGRQGTFRHLRALRKLDFSRQATIDIQARQDRLLTNILNYAFDHSAWNRQRFIDAGIKRVDLQIPLVLKSLPIVTRAELRENMDEILSDEIPRAKLLSSKTGGSTMEPLMFYRDGNVLDYRMAFELLLNEAAGWCIGEPWVNYWGHLDDIPSEEVMRKIKYTIANGLSRRMIPFNATFVEDEKLAELASVIRRKRPTWMFGYPRAIAAFARFIIRESIELPPVRGVLVTAEPTTPEDHEAIEKCFGVRALDRYASRELGMVSQECSAHCGLHIMTDNVHVEFLDHEQGKVESDSIKRIVATDLHNRAMPLIRYETDDVASPLPFPDVDCGCRFSGMPLMTSVGGRITDMFIRRDGTWFTGLDVPGMRMAETGWVNQIQYIQTGIDEVTVRIVKGEKFTDEVIPYLQKEVDDVFVSSVRLTPEFVDRIEKTKSGKFMYSIQKTPEDEICRITGAPAPKSNPTST